MPSAQSHLIRLRSKRTALAAALALLIGSPAPAVTLLESEDTLYNLNLLTFFHIDFADQISGEDQPGAPQQVQGFEEARLVGHFSSQLGTRWSAFMEVEGTATRDNSTLRVLVGTDRRPGWLSSSLGKTTLYDTAADVFRDGETIIHSFDTFTQLSSIDGSTLRAPEGEMDDLADSYALALVARTRARRPQRQPGSSQG